MVLGITVGAEEVTVGAPPIVIDRLVREEKLPDPLSDSTKRYSLLEENEESDKEKEDEDSKSSAEKVLKEKLEKKEPKDLAERLDKLGLLYKNDDNPTLQEWWFLGRYHGQYHASDGNVGSNDDWENRRFRIGSQARVFEKVTLHAQMISSPDLEKFYGGFTELWASWKFDDALVLTVGQQKHRFTHERNVSSRYINTLERSLVINMFNSEYTPAVTLLGTRDDWTYYTGVFSNFSGPDTWKAFTDFDAGWSYLFSVTRNVKEQLGVEQAFWNSCYLYSDYNQNSSYWNYFKDGLSTALILSEGKGYFISELVYGGRGKNGNALSMILQPGYFLTDKLQLATRYQLAGSNEENGLLAQRRYERDAGLTTGDLYQAGYVGLNYFVASHRIKLMSGVEYANLSGDDLWTASIMFRTYWGPHSSGPFPMAQTL